jgi:hypothetical protein
MRGEIHPRDYIGYIHDFHIHTALGYVGNLVGAIMYENSN